MSAVITDFATISTPIGNGAAMMDAASSVVMQLPDALSERGSVRVGRHGLLRYQERSGSGVATVSASGWVLAELRAAGLLFEYCAAIASASPYHVTHIDAALDRMCDPPSELQLLYGRLRIAGCALTRKVTHPRDIKVMLSRGEHGRDTGSIMIGNRRSAETTAIVYDRQADALSKGKPDPGPLLRTEIRTGVPGLSLRDVYEPEPLFYHFASPGLMPKPDHVSAWAPWGEMYDLERSQLDPADVLRLAVERSGDLERLMRLADAVPGDGLGLLVRYLAQAVELHRHTRAFAAGVSGAVPTGEQLRSH